MPPPNKRGQLRDKFGYVFPYLCIDMLGPSLEPSQRDGAFCRESYNEESQLMFSLENTCKKNYS